MNHYEALSTLKETALWEYILKHKSDLFLVVVTENNGVFIRVGRHDDEDVWIDLPDAGECLMDLMGVLNINYEAE